MRNANDLIKRRGRPSAENRKVVGKLFSVFRANTPQLYVDLNRDQCQTMGVNPNDVFSTLQIYLGSFYVNDFNRFGRTWQVVVQAGGEFRDDPEKIKLLKVRNAQRRNGAARRRPGRQGHRRADQHRPLQHVPRRRHPRRHRARHLDRPGHRGDGSPVQRDLAAGHGVRVDRDQLHADRRRQEHLEQPDLPAGGGVRVPGAGGPVRKLGAAAGRHPGRADVHPRLAHRRGRSRMATSTSSRRSASWCWSAWRARTPS